MTDLGLTKREYAMLKRAAKGDTIITTSPTVFYWNRSEGRDIELKHFKRLFANGLMEWVDIEAGSAGSFYHEGFITQAGLKYLGDYCPCQACQDQRAYSRRRGMGDMPSTHVG